jgi:diguanylate cyclase (GGDEF)-like protein/PAS domain S-box-containing protein
MFRRVSHKIMTVVGISVGFGMLLTVAFYSRQQESAILAQNERVLRRLTDSVIQGLQSVMLAGHAEDAQAYADRLKEVPGITNFLILRNDGSEAFRDNRTIEDVNRRRGVVSFLPRPTEANAPVLPPGDPLLIRVLHSPQPFGVYAPGGESVTFLAQIPNQEACHKCHGSADAVRGVLMLTMSLAPLQRDIAVARQQSLVFAAVALVAMLLLSGYMIARTVARPIQRVTAAMSRIAGSTVAERIPDDGRDEISQMVASFNRMGEELTRSYEGLKREQDKLTTIITSADEGIVVTDGQGSVVLVNPAAEVLLGKSAAQVMRQGFMHVFDAPEEMQRRLDSPLTAPEIIAYNQRTLSLQVSTIRDRNGVPLGSAALFRDITEEKRLEEELRRLSATDPLTGLYNRRHLAEALGKELERSRRHRLPLSVLICDVDHFKLFNDRYGHECGDLVLRMVAQQLTAALRTHDLPCRYGGEEFVAVLPSTSQAGAYSVAERLRRDIAAAEVNGLHVTVSVGVASFPWVAADSPQALVDAADRALYDAKEAGRNRVRVARPRG